MSLHYIISLEIVWNSMLPKPDKKVHMVVVTDPFHLSVTSVSQNFWTDPPHPGEEKFTPETEYLQTHRK